jgi:hypothetical protein
MSKKQKSPEEIYYENRSKWIEEMFDHPDMTHADFKVLYFIGKRSGFENKGMYWSVSLIARRCQCSTRTVSDATTKAANLGWLRVLQSPGKENTYEPIFYWL